MKKLLLSLTLVLANLVSGVSLMALEGLEEVSPLVFPRTPREKIEGSVKKLEFDGMSFDKLYLTTKDITWEMPPLRGWREDKVGPAESYALAIKGTRSARLAFTLFKENEFFPDLNLPTLKRYAKYLQQKHFGKVEFLNADKDFSVRHTFFIFGVQYKLFDYLVTKGGKVERFRDYVLLPKVGDKKYCLIISHQGDQEVVQSQIEDLTFSLRHTVQYE